ncbi:MAG: hypothetical protein PUB21_06445 [Bacteroidales bacterium]|nr:hypothetical protein [Bacteroidales bacterium]
MKKLQKESEAGWMRYVRNQTVLPSHCLKSKETENLNQIIDDISILIKSQQSDCGGILAGHAYYLAYVRDQYGASRALLALGHQKEARKILDFTLRYGKNTFHFKGSLYFCANCMKKENSSIVVLGPERFRIISSALLPFYIHSDLFNPEEKNNLLNVVI